MSQTSVITRMLCCNVHVVASIGFLSQHYVVNESSGQVNIEIGVISGSLSKDVTVTVTTLGLDALGKTL